MSVEVRRQTNSDSRPLQDQIFLRVLLGKHFVSAVFFSAIERKTFLVLGASDVGYSLSFVLEIYILDVYSHQVTVIYRTSGPCPGSQFSTLLEGP